MLLHARSTTSRRNYKINIVWACPHNQTGIMLWNTAGGIWNFVGDKTASDLKHYENKDSRGKSAEFIGSFSLIKSRNAKANYKLKAVMWWLNTVLPEYFYSDQHHIHPAPKWQENGSQEIDFSFKHLFHTPSTLNVTNAYPCVGC